MKKAVIIAMLFALACGIPVFAAGTPAGTQIKNQATASYKDASGASQTSVSNEVVTIVTSIYGVTVKPDGTIASPLQKVALAGSTVYQPYVLTNTGNSPDTYSLATSTDASNTFVPGNIKVYFDANGNGVMDSGESVITTTASVPADGVVNLVLAFDVPATAVAGNFALVNITATSTNESTVKDEDNWVKATVTSDSVISASKSVSAAGPIIPGAVLTYTIKGENIGSAATTARSFSTIDTDGNGVIDGNDSASGILVEDPIPAGTHILGTAADFDYKAPVTAVYLYGYGNGNWSTVSTVAAWGAPTKVGMYIPGALSIGQGYEFRWKTTVNNPATTTSISNKATVLWRDKDGDKTTETNTVVSNLSLSYAVKIGPNGNPEAAPADDFTAVASAAAGTTVSFINTVKNNGTADDSFNISYAWTANEIPGATVAFYTVDGVSPLGDSNGDGFIDTGMVAKNGGAVNIVVKVTIPGSAATDSLSHEITVTAKSGHDATKSDTTVDKISNGITAGATNLTNNNTHLETAYGQSGAPGTVLTYPLKVVNGNAFSETYTITQTVALPAGWTVLFYPDANKDGIADLGASPITVTPSVPGKTGGVDGEYTFVAQVSIPAGQLPIAGDPEASGTGQNLKFKVTGASSGQTDEQRDWAEVTELASFTFDPNNVGSTTAGGTVFYTHTLKNTGNVAQTLGVTLDASSKTAAGWIYTFSADGGTTWNTSLAGIALAPGASKEIRVKVYVPANAVIGESDAASIKAANTAAVSITRTDTTTVVSGVLTLTKSVTAVNVAGTTTVNQPGDELKYAVVYKNISSQALTDVIIIDHVPQFTGFKLASATGPGTIAYSKDSGTTWDYVPVDQAGGAPAGYDYLVTTVRWTIGAVNSGASDTIGFSVVIK